VGYEDFESGLESWLADSAGWRLFFNGHSSRHSVNSSPVGNYPPNQDVSLTSKYGVDLSRIEAAALKFWTAHFIEEDNDAGFIEVSTDGAATWQRLSVAYTGTHNLWKAESVSLANFCGPGFDDVRIRFRFISDATQSQPRAGWFIDEVSVIPVVETAVAENESAPPERFALHQNYPNPFWSEATSSARSGGNPATVIQYELPKPAQVKLAIYNLLGEKIRTLVEANQPVGMKQATWDGRDAHGQHVSSGVYFYRLEAGEFTMTRRLVLMK
jgi:hypothetical protein